MDIFEKTFNEWKAKDEAKEAVKATPAWKDYKEAKKDYKKVKKDYKKAKKAKRKAEEAYWKAKEAKEKAAKDYDEAVDAVYATPEHVEWDAMCKTQEDYDKLWK